MMAPKLKVRTPWYPFEETYNLEEAQYHLFNQRPPILVTVDGQVIGSYRELIQLAAQDDYKDREFVEATATPYVVAGG